VARHARYGECVVGSVDTSEATATANPSPWDGSAEACALVRPGGSGWGPARERAFGHAGYQSSIAFADPEHDLAVAVIFHGMIPHDRQEERARETLGALYEDLGLAP
jgi:CubicO group peptidase (beta-lactamase class C family)